MKYFLFFSFLFLILLSGCKSTSMAKRVMLFDGETFKGWEGDTINIWRIENGAITGGSLLHTVAHNDFICTDRSYDNFILRLKIKLTGNEGFVNSGLQFRSKRLIDLTNEIIGYLADWGEGFWAGLYNESRRGKTLIAPDSVEVLKWIKKTTVTIMRLRPRIYVFN